MLPCVGTTEWKTPCSNWELMCHTLIQQRFTDRMLPAMRWDSLLVMWMISSGVVQKHPPNQPSLTWKTLFKLDVKRTTAQHQEPHSERPPTDTGAVTSKIDQILRKDSLQKLWAWSTLSPKYHLKALRSIDAPKQPVEQSRLDVGDLSTNQLEKNEAPIESQLMSMSLPQRAVRRIHGLYETEWRRYNEHQSFSLATRRLTQQSEAQHLRQWRLVHKKKIIIILI